MGLLNKGGIFLIYGFPQSTGTSRLSKMNLLLTSIHTQSEKTNKMKHFHLSQNGPWPRIRDKPFAYEFSIIHYVVSSEMSQVVGQLLSRFKLRH